MLCYYCFVFRDNYIKSDIMDPKWAFLIISVGILVLISAMAYPIYIYIQAKTVTNSYHLNQCRVLATSVGPGTCTKRSGRSFKSYPCYEEAATVEYNISASVQQGIVYKQASKLEKLIPTDIGTVLSCYYSPLVNGSLKWEKPIPTYERIDMIIAVVIIGLIIIMLIGFLIFIVWTQYEEYKECSTQEI
ncbi:hypothetical protein I4U23_016359 [Adineta vaga]|nr:hypothetical protein I4U23_016359 [Adineta vaga]